ncbi:hypothetical protein [Brenneria uluponensis]|uniref:hypothetical protein n=1 Tax=Brenneria uluponensis TaxID=3057057 RepID=UPI0028F0F0DD|nr:hypothetical protein [Brenneria ulupoensis]
MIEYLLVGGGILIFMLFAYLICHIWLRRNTGKLSKFTFKDRRKADVSLHIQLGKSPVGDMAGQLMFSYLRSALRELKACGYKTVKFRSHLVRREHEESFRTFLMHEGMSISKLSYIPTPRYDRLSIYAEMFARRQSKPHVHHETAQVVIQLKK